MSMKIKLEIVTNVYDKPLICEGVKETGSDFFSYTWEDKRENDMPATYTLRYLTTTSTLELKRTGEVTSLLVFEQGRQTKGKFVTPYGEMELTIATDYINLPNVFSPKLEFAYRMLENSDMDKNTFAIREI